MARITLHSGFTTVRDVGVYRGLTDVALRDAIAAGEVEGPRMFVAGGYITIPGGGGAVTGRQARNRHRAGIPHRRGARRPTRRGRGCKAIIGGGADFIKLIATGAVLAIGSEPGALELTPEDDEGGLRRGARRWANIASPMPMARKASRRRSAPGRGPSSMPR